MVARRKLIETDGRQAHGIEYPNYTSCSIRTEADGLRANLGVKDALSSIESYDYHTHEQGKNRDSLEYAEFDK